MAIRMSNNVIRAVTLVTLLLSVPIIVAGVWLRSRAYLGIGPARHGTARHDGYRAKEARRALRAVPHRPASLAFGPGTGLWAIFRAVLAREARQK